MNSKRKKRLTAIIAMLIGMGLAVSLVLLALSKNINLYLTPSQLTADYTKKHLRLGGLVKKGSIIREHDSLKLTFTITDLQKEVKVEYTGIVPVLFKETQGVVVEGRFTPAGTFQADQVLAKHDENYRPPGLKKSSKK